MRSTPEPATPLARAAFRLILGAGLVLVLAHGVLYLSWTFRNALPPEAKDLFDVKSERGFVTWLTVVTNALVGVCCLVLGALDRSRAWYGTGAFFLYLSCDDATLLHERIGWLAKPLLGEQKVFVWVMVLGPILALMGLAVFLHLWRSSGRGSGFRRCLVMAFGMLAMAILLEVCEKPLTSSGVTLNAFPLWGYTTPIEELLELAAPALLLGCIGGMLERRLRGVVAIGRPTGEEVREIPGRRAG